MHQRLRGRFAGELFFRDVICMKVSKVVVV